jgi:pyrroloquinoline quinone (PQQ) biosynthesis protein C
MTDLKSLLPEPKTELDYIARYRYKYKYINDKTSVYILAYFIKHYDNDDDDDEEGRDIVEWSLYHDKDRILLEDQISAMSDFTDMTNSAGWEDQGYEIVPSK